MNHALILGGGLAGIEAAIQLRKRNIEVTLVSNREYVFVYPLSIWIPVDRLPFNKACLSIREIAEKHSFQFIMDEVRSIDTEQSRVTLSNTIISYDNLVLAMGSEKMPIPGVEQTHSLAEAPEKSLSLQSHLQQLVQQGKGRIAVGFGGNPHDSSAVRGGPAFELIFNIHNHLKSLHLRDQFELHFFAPMENPGIRLGEKAAKEIFRLLDRLHIQRHFGKKIQSFSDNAVYFEDGTTLDADLVAFISARNGHPLFQSTNLPLNKAGFIKIDNHCQVLGLPHVYAIGDCAALNGPDWKAKQGHIAEVMAKTVAINIARQMQNQPHSHEYVDKLSIICLLDMGNGGALVYRDHNRQWLIPLPIVGHWLKRLWGKYYFHSKRKQIPRIPGM